MERLFVDFCRIEDKYQEDRISRMINLLYEALQKNKQYWKQVDSLAELILKLCRTSKLFCILLRKNQQILRILEQFSKESYSLPVGSGPFKMFKDRSVNWTAIPQNHKNFINEQTVLKIGEYNKLRWTILTEVIKQQINNSFDHLDFDSDDDCLSLDYKEKESVDARFNKPSISLVGWH